MSKSVTIDEGALRKEFVASPDLQREFGNDEDAFLAYKRAEARGDVSVCGRGRDRRDRGAPPGADDEYLRSMYRNNPRLQAEFGGDEDAYVSFTKAAAAGSVVICGRRQGPENTSGVATTACASDSDLRAAYRACPGLRAEFQDEDEFIQYRKAERAGLVTVLSRR